MTFKEVLAQVIDWLQQDKRLSYRALQRQFALDNDYLDDLKAELIEVRRVAVDEDGRILVWTGDTPPVFATPTVPTVPRAQGLLTYTLPYLAEQILTSRSAAAPAWHCSCSPRFLQCHAGRNPLPTGLHPGRRARHASAPGLLSPGLGTLSARTVQREYSYAKLSAAIDLYRNIEMTFWLPQAEVTLAQMG